MKIVHSMHDIPPFDKPIFLTIGVYDGLHLGHQAILKQLQKISHKRGAQVVVTFSNHPSTYLKPNASDPLLIPFNHRLKLLKDHGINLAIALSFNQNLANQTYSDFFQSLSNHLPIAHLVVGDDARFGKDRKGGEAEIRALGLFKTTYVRKQTYHKESISSGNIRFYLKQGNLKQVKKMLGRPYSIRLPFDPCNVVAKNDFQYKWTTGIEKVCLLPSAVYGVDLHTVGKKIPAIAFYRGSHSINHETILSLTLIFEKPLSPAKEIEITFVSYLHNELDKENATSSYAHLLESLKPEFFPS